MTFPYQVAVGPYTGFSPQQVLTMFDSWTLQKNLDDGCSMRFSLMANSIPGVAITELETDVWIYLEGVLVERLRVIEVDQEWDANGATRKTVTAVCYRRLLASRYVQAPLAFALLIQGQIVQALIAHTQGQPGGNLGITYGSMGPVQPRSRTYVVGTNILDAITELTQVENPLTWEIDPYLVLNVSVPGAYPIAAQPVEVGTNALSLSKPSGAAKFANVALASGDLQFVSPTTATSAGILTDPRGRWEKYQAFPNIQTLADLDEQARGLLAVSTSPQIVYQFELEPGRFLTDSQYGLGDFVTIVEPAQSIWNTTSPTTTTGIVPSSIKGAQVIAQEFTVTPDGNLRVVMSAVLTGQRWDDIPAGVPWNGLPTLLTWDSLANTYIT